LSPARCSTSAGRRQSRPLWWRLAVQEPGGRRVEVDTPKPALYERFTVTYPSGTVIPSFYVGGVTLKEVQVTHPMAVVEAVEDSLVGGVPGA
jgi:hypothetical protein